MTLISRYPLGPCQQALLAAMVCPPQPILSEKTMVASNLGSPDEPAELITDFEDHRNHGIGE
jgi:hypothetical protein